ncbi:MAG: hypothetical protein Q4A07_06170 [Coriobacteriales bacterium]|nr:hypothetical protein [Coriobacteriales bacterium]
MAKKNVLARVVAVLVMGLLLCASAGVSRAYALGIGDSFTKSGNTYRVTEYDPHDNDYEAVLVTYGSSNTTPTVNKVTYKGKTFDVEGIGAGAFNTKQGHKVTSIKVGRNVDRIGKRAFKGCKKLATLNLRAADVVDLEYEHGAWVVDDLNIASNALSGAGTKNLKVLCGKSQKAYRTAYKKALVLCGMRTSAKVVR